MKLARFISIFLLISTICVLMILAIVKIPNQKCESIKITPHSQNESVVVTPQDIRQMMADAHMDIIGKKIKEIDLEPLSQLLEDNPYIEKVNFVHFSNSKLLVDYTLKQIVLHVFNEQGQHYFVDSKGMLLPFSSKMTDYLPIANGHIQQSYKKGAKINKDLLPIFVVSQEINKDDFYKAQFRQLYRNDQNQIELVSSVGHQIILFGDEQNAAEKLSNLKHVFQDGLTHLGYDRYAQLDARFKNRIVAQKK